MQYEQERLTDKVSSLLDYPSRWAVEAMIITRRKVYDSEEQLIPWFDGFASHATSAVQCRLNAHFQGYGGVVGESILEVAVQINHRRINLFPKFLGWRMRVVNLLAVRF